MAGYLFSLGADPNADPSRDFGMITSAKMTLWRYWLSQLEEWLTRWPTDVSGVTLEFIKAGADIAAIENQFGTNWFTKLKSMFLETIAKYEAPPEEQARLKEEYLEVVEVVKKAFKVRPEANSARFLLPVRKPSEHQDNEKRKRETGSGQPTKRLRY